MNPERASDHDRVGPYTLVKAIGAGGSARIDLARIDRAYGFQRHVVIKRPLEHLRSDPRAAASLRREASIGARLRHPNLVAILDTGVHDGYDYLVLEYIHGGSLRTLMQADSPSRVRACSTGVAIAIVGDVARALHEAHELADEQGHPLGLVHRDVSPGNILIGLDGAVKLADFGIAKETRVQTLSGSMHGTVTYMAPEQCRGHAFDRRADVWALGVILHELVTGARLFWADNDVASLHKVLSGNVPRPRKLRPSLTPALEDIIMTAVAPDPNRRFATARDLADALELHAAEAGAILGARWVARWTQDILGPRDVPWIAPTIPDIDKQLEHEASLVDVIAALEDEPPPNPTFGPAHQSWADEVDTKPRRSPPGKHRGKILASVIAFGLAGGAGVTALVMTRDPAQLKTSLKVPLIAPPAPVVEEEAPPVVVEEQQAPPQVVEEQAPPPVATEVTPPEQPRPIVKKKKQPPVVVDEQKPPPEPPKAGSATKPPPKAEWNPDILLPTDPGSGTKKK